MKRKKKKKLKGIHEKAIGSTFLGKRLSELDKRRNDENKLRIACRKKDRLTKKDKFYSAQRSFSGSKGKKGFN